MAQQAVLSALHSVQDAAASQAELLRFLLADARLRPPLLVIWVASFGGALHSPVTTFFMLKVGATEADIGVIGFWFSAGSLFMPPVYGYIQDRYGAYPVMMLSIILCSVGCAVRGFATGVPSLIYASMILGLGGVNLWTSVMSFIAAHTPQEKRALVISGYLFQVSILRLAGTSAYPAWAALLAILFPGNDDATLLFRDRVTMGVCTFFCFSGLFQLLICGGATRNSKPLAGQEDAEVAKPPVLQNLIGGNELGGSKAEGDMNDAGVHWWSLAVLAACLVAQSTASNAAQTLWPLWLRDRLAWGSTEFAYVLFASNLLSALAVAAVPALMARHGRYAIPACAAAIASVGAMLGFGRLESVGSIAGAAVTVAWHITLALFMFVSLAALEPSLKSLASLQLPPRLQGSSFGGLAALSALGGVIGNLAGTRLYPANTNAETGADKEVATSSLIGPLPRGVADLLLEQQEAIPFICCGGLLVLTAVALVALGGSTWSTESLERTKPEGDDASDDQVQQTERQSRLFAPTGKGL